MLNTNINGKDYARFFVGNTVDSMEGFAIGYTMYISERFCTEFCGGVCTVSIQSK